MQNGDVLLCRDDNGSLLTVAKLIEGGVEVNKQTFSAPHFEQLAGPRERLVCSDGRSLVDAGFESAAPSPEPPLLDDHNDEFCFVCALGGDLICCETCPNTFHTECVGLKEVPQGDWHCPACCCARCGGAAFDPPVESSPARHVPCNGNFTLLPASNAAVKQENGTTDASEAVKKEDDDVGGLIHGCLHFKKSLLPARPFACKPAVPVQPTFDGLGGSGPLDGILKPAVPALHMPVDSSNIPGAAEVRCCGGGPRLHYACLPQDQREALAHSGPWFASIEEAQRSRHLADCCAAGRLPVTKIPPSEYSPGGEITFQLIHCAAAAGSECTGIVPGYTEDHKQDLRKILSAALCILRASYRQIKDSRTGADIMTWLLRGASFSHGAADYSNTHLAVLFLDNVVVGAACLRSLCDGIIELPLFTIRQELRRNKLGEVFLSRVESVVDKAGFNAILTPAMVIPGWPLSPSAFNHDQPIPGAAQARWGYRLATRAEMQKLAKHRPLVFPGVFFSVKSFKGPGAATPVMPQATPVELTLAPEINVKFLQDRKLIAFKYEAGTDAEVKMTAPPGDELYVKPGEGLRTALAEERYKRQLEAYDDLMDDDDEEVFIGNGGGRGRRGRPPGRKNSATTTTKAAADKTEKAELLERHRSQTMAQVHAMMAAQQQAQQLMMAGAGLPFMMPPSPAGGGGAGGPVPGGAQMGLPPQVPAFNPAAAAAAQQASQQAAALNYYNPVNPAMNPQYLALQQLQAAQAQSFAAMESRLRMDQANLAAQMYAMQQQAPPMPPPPQTFAGIPQQPQPQQQAQQQAPPSQQIPGMAWPPNFNGNPYQGPSG